MEVTVIREYDLVPEWNGNKNDAKPIVFKMRRLTTAERDRLIRYKITEDGKINLEPDRQGLFITGVVGIEQLTVNSEAVKTARDFLSKPGLDNLFIEVVSDVIGQNSKEDSKNL